MSKRLQIVLQESEYEYFQGIAARKHITLSDWVRQALREAGKQEPKTEKKMKLEAVRNAIENSFPTADIEQMLSEIEAGYSEL